MDEQIPEFHFCPNLSVFVPLLSDFVPLLFHFCPFLFHFCPIVRNVCTNRHCAGGQAASCVTWGMRILSESMMPLMLENGKDCRKGVRECAAGAGGRPARYIETDTRKEEGERM